MGLDKDDVDDRREAPRHRVELPLECSAQEHFLYARMIDLSILGMFIATDEMLEVGMEIDLSIHPPADWLASQRDDEQTEPVDTSAIELRGSIVWATDGTEGGRHGMGIRFEHVDPIQKSRLLELIERVALVREAS